MTIKTPNFKTKVPRVLNVISYSEFAPISYGVDGQGFEGDLLRAIASLWNIPIEFHPVSIYDDIWMLPSQASQQADIAMGGITPTPARLKQGAIFSVGTTSFAQSLLVRKTDIKSGRIDSYHFFKDNHLKIGVVPGTTGELYASRRAKENNLPPDTIVPYESESLLIPALLEGEIDAIARGEIGNKFQELKHKELIYFEQKDFNEHFSYAVDKSNPNLALHLNAAITFFTDNGKIEYEQWSMNKGIFWERKIAPKINTREVL
jgi:ABC-type amino acid transport substrate-binding protein